MKKWTSLILAGLLTLSLAACGGNGDAGNNNQNNNTQSPPEDNKTELTAVVVGASPAPHAQILEFIKPQMEALGFELEVVEFTDYVLPNNTLDAGELDANYFQHEPYLLDFNEKNNMELATAAKIHFEPLGIYPGKSKDLANVPDGAVIGVPADSTNEARALNLLEALGLIKLKEGVGLEATPKDIAENPKNIKIMELEAVTIPQNLPDLDFGVVNGNYALSAGIVDTVLEVEANSSEAGAYYPNVLAVRKADLESDKTKALVKALTSEETRKFIEETYGKSVIPVF